MFGRSPFGEQTFGGDRAFLENPMSSIKPNYTLNTITMTLAALASSSTFVAGRESNQIDNTTPLYSDAVVYPRFSVGTSPTTNTALNIYVWGADVSLATKGVDVLDGTDSAETLTNTTVLGAALQLARSVPIIATTSDVEYDVIPFSVCQALGVRYLPLFWGIYVAHNMTAALRNNAVNNNSFRYHGIFETVN